VGYQMLLHATKRSLYPNPRQVQEISPILHGVVWVVARGCLAPKECCAPKQPRVYALQFTNNVA
jgi:hypothetical protein